jgi:hypothetical protein
MARAKRATTPVVYQIKVILKGSRPPIWRRIQVTSDTTLARLHRILQRVMGWEGSISTNLRSVAWSTATRECWKRWRAKTPRR